MIDRDFYNGPIVVCCDGCASAYVETGEKDFAAGIAVAKDEGWAVRFCGEGHGWCHFCEECSEQRVWEGESPDLRRSWGRKGGRA